MSIQYSTAYKLALTYEMNFTGSKPIFGILPLALCCKCQAVKYHLKNRIDSQESDDAENGTLTRTFTSPMLSHCCCNYGAVYSSVIIRVNNTPHITVFGQPTLKKFTYEMICPRHGIYIFLVFYWDDCVGFFFCFFCPFFQHSVLAFFA